MDPRLSYLQSSEHKYDEELARMFNPVLNLSETFNSLSAGDEGCHLRVFLRVRPCLPGEEEGNGEIQQVQILDAQTVLLTAPSSSNTFKNTSHGITKLTHKFSFSHVYGPSTSQLELYEHTTKSMMSKFINGQNCLLFTYGATNSGKTYTVQGGAGNEQGLLPRMLASLFRSVGGALYPHRDLRPQHHCDLISLGPKDASAEEERRETLLRPEAAPLSRSNSNASNAGGSRSASPDIFETSTNSSKEPSDCSELIPAEEGFVYAVFVSFAEIYNETVYDLLERLPPGCKKRNPHLLGEDRNGASYIKGLYDVRVDSASEALRVLEVGRQNLRFATTRLNHNSSRSHCIFTVKLVHLASPDTPKYARVSMFSICDLAGAERVAKTQGCGERLKEAGNINTSLLVLSRCIVALRQNQMSQRSLLESTTTSTTGAGVPRRREVPVPYRDSKLTRLLQNFFLGHGIAAMIVNISQAPALFDETLQVLKFSAVAKRVITCQDQPQATQVVETRQSSSQLSRLIRQSLRHRSQRSSTTLPRSSTENSAARLSVPWLDSSVNVTFGDDKKNEGGMRSVAEEAEGEEDDDDDEDERIQSLVEHMRKLTDALARVNQEKKDLEVHLRSQLCSEFSKQLVEVESNWRRRMEDQQARSDELHDWRIAKLTEFYSEYVQPRKRVRTDDAEEDTSALEDSIVQFRQQSRVEELEAQVSELQEQLEGRAAEADTLSATLKKTSEASRKVTEENTKLQFQLAALTADYDQLKAQLASAEKVAESAVPESEALHELQSCVAELQQRQKQLTIELQENREMLVEAAECYALKEKEAASLGSTVATLRQTIAEQSVALEQACEELTAAQQLTGERMRELEEREAALEETQQQLASARELVRQLRAQAAELGRHPQQPATSPQQEQELASLRRDKELLLEEVEELRKQLTSCASRETATESDVAKWQKANANLQLLLEAKEEQLRSSQNESDRLSEKVEAMEAQLADVFDKLVQNDTNQEKINEVPSDFSELSMRKKSESSDLYNGLAHLKGQNAVLNKLNACVGEASTTLGEQNKVENGEKSPSGMESESSKLASQRGDESLRAELVALRQRALESVLRNEEQKAKNRELQFEVESTRQELGHCQRNLEEKLLELEALKVASSAEAESSSDKEAELIEARSRIAQLEELVLEKSEQLLEVENLKNDLKRLAHQNAINDERTMTEKASLTSMISQLEGELKITQAELSDLKKVHSEIMSEKEERERTFATDKEKLLQQLEENKKVHISATRYKDCELASAKKEAEDVRQQLGRLREEKAAAQQLRDALAAEHEAKLTDLAQQFTEVSREKETLAGEIAALRETVQNQREDLEQLRSEMSDLKERLSGVTTAHQRELSALQGEKEALEHQLEEARATLTQKENEKIQKLKEDLKRSKETCQMLQKEAAAVREARVLEVQEISELRTQLTLLQEASCNKDEEILALQIEVKKALASGVMPAVAATPPSRAHLPSKEVKQEPSLEETLKEQLRAKEAEVCALMHQLSLTRDQPSPSVNTKPVVSSSPLPPPSPELLPPPPASAPRKVPESRAGSESDSSVMSAPASGRARRTRPKTPSSSVRVQVSSEANSSVRRSTRRTRGAVVLQDEGSDSDEVSSETYEPPRRGGRRGAASTKRSTRSKKPPRLVNPHLENKENRCSLANKYESVSEVLEAVKTMPKTASRGRRRRQLYEEDAEQPLYCSPQLVDPMPPADSPHTTLRRQLRAQAK